MLSQLQSIHHVARPTTYHSLFPNFLSLHTKPLSITVSSAPCHNHQFLAAMNLTHLDVSQRWTHTRTVVLSFRCVGISLSGLKSFMASWRTTSNLICPPIPPSFLLNVFRAPTSRSRIFFQFSTFFYFIDLVFLQNKNRKPKYSPHRQHIFFPEKI